MIAPDDPRHGTRNGANICQLGEPRPDGRPRCCEACRLARNAYERQRLSARIRGVPGFAPSVGLQRRMRALCALGYTQADLAQRLGVTVSGASRLLAGGGLDRGAHWKLWRRVTKLYDELSMTLGPSELGRQRARSKGWPPPLAWDDDQLDDPNGKPATVVRDQEDRKSERPVNPLVIQSVLAGVRMGREATVAERKEATRLWLAAGRSLAELGRIQGWQADRYRDKGGVAA